MSLQRRAGVRLGGGSVAGGCRQLGEHVLHAPEHELGHGEPVGEGRELGVEVDDRGPVSEPAPHVRWRDSPDVALSDQLASTYDQLHVAPAEHLEAEEQRLLPIVSWTLSQAEWDLLGNEGRRRGSFREGPLVVGMFQYEGDPVVFARMIAHAPRPVRAIFPRVSTARSASTRN